MRAAILREHGAIPEVGDFDEPAPDEHGQVVEVLAAGLNPVDIALASGTFYGGAPPLPSVVGKEGIGRTAGGDRVYFDTPLAPYGSVAERAKVHAASLFPVPEEDVADELVLAFGIAGLAAWLSLEKAEVQEGETVLVLGASGMVWARSPYRRRSSLAPDAWWPPRATRRASRVRVSSGRTLR